MRGGYDASTGAGTGTDAGCIGITRNGGSGWSGAAGGGTGSDIGAGSGAGGAGIGGGAVFRGGARLTAAFFGAGVMRVRRFGAASDSDDAEDGM